MADEVSELPWAQQTPLVVDRAMGRGVTVDGLMERDVHFVTAVPAPEIVSYSTRIPLGVFEDPHKLGVDDKLDKQARRQLHDAAVAAGFEKVTDQRYVFDLGVFDKGEGGKVATASWLTPSRAKAALELARCIKVERDKGVTQSELALRYDCTTRFISRWSALLALSDELQRQVMAGKADRVAATTLQRIAQLSAEQQRAAFEQACLEAGDGPPLRVNRTLARLVDAPPLKVRAVVLFNPESFYLQRQAAAQAKPKAQAIVDDLNRRLRSPRCQLSGERAVGKANDALRKRDLGDVFTVQVDKSRIDGRAVPQLRIVRDDATWQRRRRSDGITLIVAHPELKQSAQQLAALYFAKDMVEKDFQAIKSVLALRPVNHQTDGKVRAHVSLCMLALLIERDIEQQLHDAGLKYTSAAALHTLETVHLNVMAGEPPLQTITEPDAEQQQLLAALELQQLASDKAMAKAIAPR
jgi:hypothetical protein